MEGGAKHREEVNIDHLLGGGWPAEYEEKMVNYVQEEEEDVFNPIRWIVSYLKKRKSSQAKKCLRFL